MVEKIFFFLLTCVALAPAGLSAQEPNTFTRYEGERITGVDASSGFEVILVSGTQTRVVVEISPELEPHLDLSLDGGILHVGLKNFKTPKLVLRRQNLTSRITVCLDELSRVEGSSAARIRASGDFKGENTVIRLTSAAKLHGLSLTTGRLTVSGSSASHASLTAKAEEVELDFSSSADGRIALSCRAVDARCSSTSALELSGTAKEADFETSSAARIDAYAFAVERLDAEASGFSSQRVWVTDTFDAEASSAATIRYRGTPARRELHSSSAATIRRVE